MKRLLSFLLTLSFSIHGFFFPFENTLLEISALQSYAFAPDTSQVPVSAIPDAAVTVSASLEDSYPTVSQETPQPSVQAPSVCLMEASTGQVIYEKDADTVRSPASITKIMTLILIFDALESGQMKLSDEVTTSSHAKSMGGSQVFLEEGEVQSVETLIKCIVIASGNDASVAMAEYIAGSEEAFVQMMNERAAGLGMKNTHFEDCCGLTDSVTHQTTARDIALMSRELITKYPQIHTYSTIWMENITHVTNQGQKEFGLSNTNKLLKMATNFEVTGLKTGSTSLAKYCLSATARKDGVHLIAAIMAAPDYKARFSDAITLLNYGFANCRLYTDTPQNPIGTVPLTGGIKDTVIAKTEDTFSYLFTHGEDFSKIQKTITFSDSLNAPIAQNDLIGSITYTLDGKTLGTLPLKAAEDIRKAQYLDYLNQVWKLFLSLTPSTDAVPEDTEIPQSQSE